MQRCPYFGGKFPHIERGNEPEQDGGKREQGDRGYLCTLYPVGSGINFTERNINRNSIYYRVLGLIRVNLWGAIRVWNARGQLLSEWRSRDFVKCLWSCRAEKSISILMSNRKLNAASCARWRHAGSAAPLTPCLDASSKKFKKKKKRDKKKMHSN